MDTLERKLPIGIQTFENIRKGGFLYVDKTAILWQIINTGKPYFLSRPRRFGKSLLISTFEAYFQGRKDLFEGLAIEKLEKKWEQYPVLHLDLNAKKYETAADLVAMLNQYLEKWEAVYGDEKKDRSPEERFSYVIEQASLKTGKGVVVLVDEYDKPLLQALLDENLLDEYRRILKGGERRQVAIDHIGTLRVINIQVQGVDIRGHNQILFLHVFRFLFYIRLFFNIFPGFLYFLLFLFLWLYFFSLTARRETVGKRQEDTGKDTH